MYKFAIVTGEWYNTEKQKQSCKHCSDGAIENEIHLLLNCPVYKDLRYSLFLGNLETDQINLSYGNHFKKKNSIYIWALKSLELLGDYILKAI